MEDTHTVYGALYFFLSPEAAIRISLEKEVDAIMQDAHGLLENPQHFKIFTQSLIVALRSFREVSEDDIEQRNGLRVSSH